MALLPDAADDIRGLQALAAAVRRSIETLAVDAAQARAAAQVPLFQAVPLLIEVLRRYGTAIRGAAPEVWSACRRSAEAEGWLLPSDEEIFK